LDSKLPRKKEGEILTSADVSGVSWIINTAEYCVTMATMLADSVTKMIDPLFKDHVTLEKETEEFVALVGKGLTMIATSLLTRLGKCLPHTSRTKWNAVEQVGDTSEYITQVNAILSDDLKLVATMVSGRSLTFFCNQWLKQFAQRFIESIYRCKSINDLGAAQLSLDAHQLRAMLADAPQQFQPEEKKAQTKVGIRLALRGMHQEMQKAENLLKVLNTAPDRIVLTWRTLMHDTKPDELAKILALKGLKYDVKRQLIDTYNHTVPPKDQIPLDCLEDKGSLAAKITAGFERGFVKVGL